MSIQNATIKTIRVERVDEIQDAVKGNSRLLARGGGSKPGLSMPADEATVLDLSALSGVSLYDPGEFTFTALAATPVHEVQGMLAKQGQYLPFDPPLAEAGATLGGTVAAGLSGPGRYRYGGVRDFLIGIRFVDGKGDLVRGGGNVVKNAAGFDFPKLMVGALGRLGILTELTFKVFPSPAATASLRADFADLAAAMDALVYLTGTKFDLDALDLVPGDEGTMLWVRLGGLPTALPERLERLAGLLHEHNVPRRIELFGVAEDASHWGQMNRMDWRPAGSVLIKVPVTPRRIRRLDADLAISGTIRRYSAGGNTALIAWSEPLAEIDALLHRHQLAGLCLDGPPGHPWLGYMTGRALLERIAATLDPEDKFGALTIWRELPTSG